MMGSLMKWWIYLLVILDLVLGAAAVGVRRLPPHQRYALLLDLLCSQFADQRRRCREEKRKQSGMSWEIPVYCIRNIRAGGLSPSKSETVFTLLYFLF